MNWKLNTPFYLRHDSKMEWNIPQCYYSGDSSNLAFVSCCILSNHKQTACFNSDYTWTTEISSVMDGSGYLGNNVDRFILKV